MIFAKGGAILLYPFEVFTISRLAMERTLGRVRSYLAISQGMYLYNTCI